MQRKLRVKFLEQFEKCDVLGLGFFFLKINQFQPTSKAMFTYNL